MTDKQHDAEIEIIDLEEFSKADKCPPKKRKYHIKVDKEKFVVDVESMTGRQILELADNTPIDRFQLNQQIRGKVETVAPDQVVDFTTPGIERFRTIPLDQGEG